MYNEATVARAKRYREYMAGYAYIPYQDIVIYERSYNLVYSK